MTDFSDWLSVWQPRAQLISEVENIGLKSTATSRKRHLHSQITNRLEPKHHHLHIQQRCQKSLRSAKKDSSAIDIASVWLFTVMQSLAIFL